MKKIYVIIALVIALAVGLFIGCGCTANNIEANEAEAEMDAMDEKFEFYIEACEKGMFYEEKETEGDWTFYSFETDDEDIAVGFYFDDAYIFVYNWDDEIYSVYESENHHWIENDMLSSLFTSMSY